MWCTIRLALKRWRFEIELRLETRNLAVQAIDDWTVDDYEFIGPQGLERISEKLVLREKIA